VAGEVRREEDRTAEEMANGKAGPSNQYGRYFDGLDSERAANSVRLPIRFDRIVN
jgi:hypothetical protein